MKKNTRVYKAVINGYELTVKDYGYTSRPPVAVRIAGTRLGESTNEYGEPCYFYKSLDAYTMEEGIQIATKIAKNRLPSTL